MYWRGLSCDSRSGLCLHVESRARLLPSYGVTRPRTGSQGIQDEIVKPSVKDEGVSNRKGVSEGSRGVTRDCW